MFVWLQGNILGINPHIPVRKLFIDPDHPSIFQKRKKFTPERLKVIEDEVSKLINTNVIQESHYSDWLANVDFTREFVDFTDLNKTCPNDNFPYQR